MDLQGGGELETEGRGVKHLLNHIRAHKPRSQFASKSGEVKVTGTEPYLLPRVVTRGGNPPPVGGTLDPVHVGDHGVAGQPPNAPTPAELGPNRGYLDLRLLRGKKGRLIVEGTLEG